MSSPNGAMVVHDPKASSGGGSSKKPKNQRSRRPQDAGYDAEFNPDDNVSEVSDDEYDANSPEEPRFKYSTADLADDSPRNTKCCLIAMCILCIIVAIAVSITMVKLQEDSNEKNAPSDPTAPPTAVGATPIPGVNMFLATQEFVEDRCSPSNFADDPRICQGTCGGGNDFDCCEPLLPRNVSCFLGNREGCLNYNRCHINNGASDPPPDNLEVICSPARLQSDRSDCEAQCQSMECCWSDELSCVVSNFYACVDYAPCQNLRADLIVPVPSDTIKDLCDTGQTGSVTQGGACEAACLPAECCWSESTLDNCLQDNFFACLAYESCKKLTLADPGTIVPKPSDDLADLCTLRNVEDAGGEAACASVCSPGACCQQGAVDYCFPDDPLGCLQYDACKLVA
jgi:hypothetical protein